MSIELLVIFVCVSVFSLPSYSLLLHYRWRIIPRRARLGPVYSSDDRNEELIPVGKFKFRISNEAESLLTDDDPLGEHGELVHILGDEDIRDSTSGTAFTSDEESYEFEILESYQSRLLQKEFGQPDDEVSFDDLMEAVVKREYLQQTHPYFGEFWKHHKRRRLSWYLVVFQKFVHRLTSQLKRWFTAKKIESL